MKQNKYIITAEINGKRISDTFYAFNQTEAEEKALKQFNCDPADIVVISKIG